jgi:D-alanyl-D-alanine carboxypeptidase/D-alanyl-D-alanine-endopeptidase (penicillin-binding protein 4)
MGDFVERAGIRRGDVLLDDGAGLSRSGMITAGATVQLLRAMAKHPAAEVFKASLPEAGTDGTLRTRLKELKGRLRAKTGTLQFVNTLSGYITTDAGEELAFSILLNAYNPVPGTNRRDEVDAIPRLIARLKERTKGAAR